MERAKKGLKGIVDGVSKMELNDAKRKGKRFRERLAKQQATGESLPHAKAGLIVSEQLDNALKQDIEFDLEKDQEQCRFGLPGEDEIIVPRPRVAVKRVTEIFDNPVFFGPNGPKASAVRQGSLGDCWFLAALSAIATVDSGALLRKLCVAHNEEVGVYGFIFFRDCYWQSVIVDDFLLWSMPKFDELKEEEKRLYHYNRENYHNVVEKSGQGLLYARSGTVGETWVPLIEKAYAKLHGDYASLDGGFLADAIEDLTGGVATSFQTADLLSQDKFWRNELQHNELHMRLFGVSLDLDETHSQRSDLQIQGLLPGHAYSVMRVHECRGKRFVVVRNPWGESEWTGAWGDGSKEWTNEWLSALPELGHSFGNDGQFLMEYKDFLTVFSQIDRATIFDPSWSMSWYWISISPQPLTRLWLYGDIQFHLSVDRDTPAVLVLSQIDTRYFRNMQDTEWHLDFIVHRIENSALSKPLATSGISLGSRRSVSCELTLEEGEYVILPRIEAAYSFITRKRNRVLKEMSMSWARVLPQSDDEEEKMEEDVAETDLPTITRQPSFFSSETPEDEENSENNEDEKQDEEVQESKSEGGDAPPATQGYIQVTTPPLFLGMRVYTQNGAVAKVFGRAMDY
uniref:Calpain catalytic domain-containing protein n=1 Tax=Psilocybe cubensis TaxID=181762 RepID=A0A8H8CMW3_PSICU